LCMERIARYCWAYDERRLDALADCFTDEAIWEGNVLGRIPIGPFVGRARIKEWLSNFWPHQRDQRRHMLLNTIVEEQTAGSVVTWSYLLLLSSDSKRVALETSGFYRVMYQQVADQWRIARLTAGFDAPFWPGDIETMSSSGRTRHGVSPG
jgi:SnoaL-like domain